MSLCRDCFHSGNHIAEGHDYNMFKSQAGGACDCGDESVMRPSGFCVKVRLKTLPKIDLVLECLDGFVFYYF